MDVLNELSEMAVQMAPEMDSRAIPNVLWAMGMIRKNPLGAYLYDTPFLTYISPEGILLMGALEEASCLQLAELGLFCSSVYLC